MLAFYLLRLGSQAKRITFRDFYTAYQQSMFSMACVLLESEELAEDAVHDALTAIYGQMSKVEKMDETERYAFAMVLARNKAIDILRKERRELPSGRMEEQLMEETETDGNSFAFLYGLPDIYQDVLRLVALGFGPQEIATMQGKKKETVYKQIARGKKLLQEKLRKEGYDEF